MNKAQTLKRIKATIAYLETQKEKVGDDLAGRAVADLQRLAATIASQARVEAKEQRTKKAGERRARRRARAKAKGR